MTIFSSFLSYGRGKAEESRKLPILNYIHCCLQLSVALTCMVLPPLILPCDLRGVHILPLDKIVGLYPLQNTIELSKITDGLELDLVTHDVHKFCRLLLKRNGYVLEQLYLPLIVHSTAEYEELKAIAFNCITRHHAHHYLGFAKTQWHLFAKEDPPRVKPLLYLYRVLLTGIYLMQTGKIEVNLNNLNLEFSVFAGSPALYCKSASQRRFAACMIAKPRSKSALLDSRYIS